MEKIKKKILDKQKNLPACLVDKLNYFVNSNAVS